MASILIIYTTREGQTRKIAEYMASIATDKGHSVLVEDSAKGVVRFSWNHVDGVIIGASIHKGHYPQAVLTFAKNHAQRLQQVPSAFFSVSLTAASTKAEDQVQARQYVTDFIKATGWQPYTTAIFAGALKYSRYGFFKRWIMKQIAKKNRGGTNTTRDYEYTDWGRVKAFAEDFLSVF